MENIFKAIRQGQEASQYTQDIAGRVYGLQWGIATADLDPSGLHRIKVRTKAKGGTEFTTNWLLCGVPFYQLSTDTPPPGSTVVFSYIDGNPNEGVYFGLVKNAVDLPHPNGWYVHRHNFYTFAINPEGHLTVSVTNSDGQTLSAFTLTSETFSAQVKNTQLSITSNDIAFTGVNSFTINGKQVATLGAKDTDGDTLVTRGW